MRQAAVIEGIELVNVIVLPDGADGERAAVRNVRGDYGPRPEARSG